MPCHAKDNFECNRHGYAFSARMASFETINTEQDNKLTG